MKLPDKCNLPIIGIILHYFEKNISIYLIAWRPIRPLYPDAFLSKCDPITCHSWPLWSLIFTNAMSDFENSSTTVSTQSKEIFNMHRIRPCMVILTGCLCKIRKISCSSPLSDKYFCRVPLSFPFQIQIDRDSHNMSCLNRKQAHNQNLKS